ncbi:MAG: DUF1851 domain-containing protein [Planctomycetaceae bacterium]
MDVNDYLIDHSKLDWQKMLSAWSWLLDDEAEIEPWLMNRFGDLFFLDEEGAVLWLNVTDGELSEVADNADEFFALLESSSDGSGDDDADDAVDFEDEGEFEDNADDWFLIGFVDEAVEDGLKPGPGECYGFKVLPVLGGDYSSENLYLSRVEEYWSFCGRVHAQIHGLPDGSEVEIDLPER